MIDEEKSDHSWLHKFTMEVSSPFNFAKDWMVVHMKYANLCMLVAKTLYGGNLARTPSECLAQIKRLHHAVLSWESLLPAEYRPIENEVEEFSDPVSKRQRSIVCDITLKFCEVMLAIHRWAMVEKMLPVDLETQYLGNIASSRAICLNIAKQILGLAQLVSANDQKSEW
jgi:hypothetical protein